MKAEHRKELQTNLLADRMGRLVQGIKAGPRSSSTFAWVVGLLVVVALVGWYWAGRQNTRQSDDWVRMLGDPHTDARAFADVARQSSGTLPGRTARFQQARALLARGLNTFYTPEVHGQAVQDVSEAGKLYRDLLGECRGNAVLEQEALLAAAKAEETLSGEPDRNDPSKKLGSLDHALALYQRLVDGYPESFEAKQAQKRLDELKDGATRARMEEFYAKLAESVKKPEGVPHPDLGKPASPPPAPTP